MTTIKFELNGATREFEPRDGESLLDALRDRFHVTSPKNGCSQGQCGACLVLMDGKPTLSCRTKLTKADGRAITTLEGLAQTERDLLAQSFTLTGASQCGFCTPGIALRTHALLESNPEPSRAEINKALDVHLCRCTGYTKIVDAIELMADHKRSGTPLPPKPTAGAVGDRLPRYDVEAQILGERPYVADLHFEGMLYGAVLQSEHARAKVVAIDTSAAEALEGVERIATAADVPGDRWYGLIYQDWPGFIAVGEETRCVGDVIAAVAAKDRQTALRAAALIDVTYEVLDPTTDPVEAAKDGARQINPRHENVLSKTVIRAGGDAKDALKGCAHVARGTWQTQRIEHLFIEPEASVATPRDGGLHLYSQGQGVFNDRRQVASFLGIDEDLIYVELVPNGGGFGGKEDMTIQGHTALLCWLTGKPVKTELTREQSIRMHPKRHPLTMSYEVGCDAEGNLIAAHVRMIGDTGAYASVGGKVLERAAGHACGPYVIPNVDIESVAVYTNNPPGGAMRGFGANQANFAMEGCLDILGDALGMDAWELRYKNAVQVGDTLPTGQTLEKSVGLKQTLEAVKPSYDAAKSAGRAVGISCGIKNSGLGNGAKEWGKARLVVEDDGSITLYNGFTEMGQGLFTILVQCAVEVTGLDPQLFKPAVNSNFVLDVGQTTGSRGTLLGGRAVEAAAKAMKVDLDKGLDVEAMKGNVYVGDIVIDDTTVPGADVDKVKLHTTYGFATQVCVLDEDGRVDKMIAAHDVGRALNPQLVEGQIQGAIHMGLGFALSEELPTDEGMPIPTTMREIGVLRAKDMPDVEVHLVEDYEPEGPFGAKGVGEIGLVPTAGAVAGAVSRYPGEDRPYVLPMKSSVAGRHVSVGKIRRRRKS